MFNDIGYLLSNYYTWFLYGLCSTILLAFIGTFGGLILGIFLALGNNIKVKTKDNGLIKTCKYILKGLTGVYSTVIRGTPMMVQAMIFKYGCQALGLNWNNVFNQNNVLNGWFFAGLIVITLNTAAYMGEIVKSGLNGIDVGQIEGAKSLGTTNFQTYFHIVLPQALKNSIPTIGNEWIVNVKDSSVLNVIGVSELYLRSTMAANKTYKLVAAYIIVAVIYLILTLIINLILYITKNKMDNKKLFPMFHFKKS